MEILNHYIDVSAITIIEIEMYLYADKITVHLIILC